MENMTGHLFTNSVLKTLNVFNLWSNINYKYFASHCTMSFPEHIMKPRVNTLGLTWKVSFLCKCNTGLCQERRKDALLEDDY